MSPFSSRICTPVKQFARVWIYTPALTALRRLQRQSRIVQVLVFLGLFAVTAWLDLAIDPDLSLFALYLIPTLYSAWFMGIFWGYVSCLASAVVCSSRLGITAFYHHTLIPHWNLGREAHRAGGDRDHCECSEERSRR